MGKAFGELLHRFEKPEVEISPLKSRWKKNETVSVKWLVKNPDEGNPLNYSVYLVKNGLSTLIAEGISGTDYLIQLNSILAESVGSRFKIMVKASSIDKTIVGDAQTPELSLEQ